MHKQTRFRRQWGTYMKSDTAVNPDFCPRRQLLGRKLCPTQKVTSGRASPHTDSEVVAQRPRRPRRRTSPSHTELDISRLLIQGKHTGSPATCSTSPRENATENLNLAEYQKALTSSLAPYLEHQTVLVGSREGDGPAAKPSAAGQPDTATNISARAPQPAHTRHKWLFYFSSLAKSVFRALYPKATRSSLCREHRGPASFLCHPPPTSPHPPTLEGTSTISAFLIHLCTYCP